MEHSNYSDIIARFEKALDTINEIKETCRVPSISFGVLHEGQTIFKKSIGLRNVEDQLSANSDSIYVLASISKAFLAAALGVLVDEGKLQWDDLVTTHVPEFDPVGDPQIAKQATFIDLLRHTAGISNPVVSWLGPQGTVLLKEQDFMEMVNGLPTASDGEQYFRKEFVYSNAAYGVAAKAIEHVSGMRYSDFLTERILTPLGLRSTAVTRNLVKESDNLAHPYAKLENGTWHKLRNEWTDENLTSVLAAYGVRSSVNDLLTWCAANLADLRKSSGDDQPEQLQGIVHNPLNQSSTICRGWWTRDSIDDSGPECFYCLGWFKTEIPSADVGWGSYNNQTTYDEEHTVTQYILGKESPKRPLLKHPGLGAGISNSCLLFPETNSAIVVLCNGLDAGDASDFTAQVLTQELFDLQPRIDQTPRLKVEVQRQERVFHDELMRDWLKNRDVSGPESPQEFLGEYRGMSITMRIQRNEATGKLRLVFNGRGDFPSDLEYYNVDTYSYMPTTRDRWMRDAWLDWDHYSIGLLQFKRDGSGSVDSFLWKWDAEEEPGRFSRIKE